VGEQTSAAFNTVDNRLEIAHRTYTTDSGGHETTSVPRFTIGF
jgi:hypothetical protein